MFCHRFLQYFSPGLEFVALAVLIRMVHATGNAAVITATFSFTAIEFQNSVGKIFVRLKEMEFFLYYFLEEHSRNFPFSP